MFYWVDHPKIILQFVILVLKQQSWGWLYAYVCLFVFLRVNHSNVAIVKPVGNQGASSNREVEEAMKKVKEAQSLISAVVDGQYHLPANPVLSSLDHTSLPYFFLHHRRQASFQITISIPEKTISFPSAVKIQGAQVKIKRSSVTV